MQDHLLLRTGMDIVKAGSRSRGFKWDRNGPNLAHRDAAQAPGPFKVSRMLYSSFDHAAAF